MLSKALIDNLPTTAGIYRFLSDGVPIYIGKSVNIKARVISHIRAGQLSAKESLIVESSDDLDFQLTVNDFDAIVLEANLIKKFRPKFNIAQKDDKHFLYIKITIKDDYPKVYAVRQEDDGKSLYFGPFSSSRMTESLLYHIRKVIPFCTQKKIGQRPCFYSKIHLCDPCPSYVESLSFTDRRSYKMKYRQNIRQLIALLKGDRGKLVSILEKELQALTIKQKFEEAIVIRDRITSLNSIIVFRSFDNPLLEDNTKKESISAELEAFLKVHFDKSLNDSYRIECYDMSTLFGTNSTGSMVVFENGTFDHSKYRRFKLDMNIRSDFERVRHVLSRRFKHEDWPMPDLIVIDGGAPQISSSQAVLDDFKLKVPLIGFAKKPDRIVFVNKKIRSTLNHDSQLFKIFQQLRDESHRFAKKYHLLLRSKNLML